MRSISSGVFTTDQEGRITSFNPAAHEVTGCAFADVQGRLWQEVFNWHPTDGSQTTDMTSLSPLRFEVDCFHANGSCLVLGMTLSPLQEQGMQRGLVGCSRTSRKFATWKRRCVGASGWRTWERCRRHGP